MYTKVDVQQKMRRDFFYVMLQNISKQFQLEEFKAKKLQKLPNKGKFCLD
jgi:hypothetical protein